MRKPGLKLLSAIRPLSAIRGLPPWVQDVTVPPPTPNNPIFVSAQILDATTVEIYYVVGFGSTELMLTMAD